MTLNRQMLALHHRQRKQCLLTQLDHIIAFYALLVPIIQTDRCLDVTKAVDSSSCCLLASF